MQIHELKRKTKLRRATRVGRGGRRGKTSGRGHKGQNARAGSSPRPEIRDRIKKLPKRRGYRFSSAHVKPAVVNLAVLEKSFEIGEDVSPNILLAKKIIRKNAGKVPAVKVLGNGEIVKKLNIKNCIVSRSAREKIEKVGGTIS